MDFTFTEEQETISKLAADVFERRATPERLTELEAGEFRYDAGAVEGTGRCRPAGHRVTGVVGRQRRWLRRTRRPAGRSGIGGGSGSCVSDAAAGCRPDRPARQSRATATLSARRHRRHPHPVRGSARARPLRPDPSGHHRPSRRRDVAAGRRQRAGVVRSARRYPADSGHDRRRARRACSCCRRMLRASRSGR